MDATLAWLLDIARAVVTFIGGMLTPAEWRAFIILCVLTLAATQMLKVVWRLSRFSGGSNDAVHLIAVSVATATSFWLWPGTGYWWIVAGIIAGPAAIFFFKISYAILKWKLPGLAAALNFERRRMNAPPPDGTDHRSQP